MHARDICGHTCNSNSMAKSPIQLLVQRYVEQRDDPLTTQLVVKRQVEQRDGPLHLVLHAPATTNSPHAQALRL